MSPQWLTIVVLAAAPAFAAPESKPAPPADGKAARQAYLGMLERLNAGDEAGYYAVFAERLVCFYGVAHPKAEVQKVRKLGEGHAVKAKVEVVQATADEVALVDRGVWRTPERVGLHEKAVLMKKTDGRWLLVGEAPLAEAACLSPDFSAVAPSPALGACRAKVGDCKEFCSNPTGSNGCESCKDGAWEAGVECLGLDE